jgi:hypothetical protein
VLAGKPFVRWQRKSSRATSGFVFGDAHGRMMGVVVAFRV